MANAYQGGISQPIAKAAVDAATVIEKGDLLYWDSDDAKPASSQADQGSEVANQALYAQNHLGTALHASRNGDTKDVLVDTDLAGSRLMTVASDTYEIGDLLGADENSGGTALLDQTLAKVNDRDLAIAVAVERKASAATSLRVRFIKSVGAVAARPRTNTEDLATVQKALTLDDARIQVLDPGGGATDVLLPPEAQSDGVSFLIKNTADAAEDLVVKEDSDTVTIVTISQNEAAIVFCDGTTWYGFVGANT